MLFLFADAGTAGHEEFVMAVGNNENRFGGEYYIQDRDHMSDIKESQGAAAQRPPGRAVANGRQPAGRRPEGLRPAGRRAESQGPLSAVLKNRIPVNAEEQTGTKPR